MQVMTFFANLIAKSFNEPLEVFLDYLIGASELEGYKCPFLSYYTKEEHYLRTAPPYAYPTKL